MKIAKQTKRYIYHQTIIEIQHSDLDLDLQDYVLGNNIDGHDYDTIEDKFNDTYNWEGVNCELEINKAIRTLQKLKKKGATHVDITPHGDHHGYYFYGSIFREATDEEVRDYKNNEKELRKLAYTDEIEKLKTAISEMENELNNDSN